MENDDPPAALRFDPNDPIEHIGEAIGLIVVALAQHVEDPHGLLEAMQRAEQKCIEAPRMYAHQTRVLVHYAVTALDGALAADAARRAPN